MAENRYPDRGIRGKGEEKIANLFDLACSVMIRRLMRWFLALLFVAFLPANLWAGGNTHYQDMIIGERAAGMGGAFIALADDAIGAYYNPAGIAVDKSTLIQLSMSAFKFRYKRVELADVCGSEIHDDQSGVFGFPGSFGFAKLFETGSVRHGLGFTVTVPASEKVSHSFVTQDTECGSNAYDIGGSNVLVDRVFLGGLSYGLHPWRFLWVGMTAGVSVRGASTTQLVTTAGPKEIKAYPSASFMHLDVNLWSLFLQFGLIVEPISGWR
ncbi:MAG: hypothetical protein V1754_13075, partial [Pseudomonadota bacterium]